ncbi:major capsid protein [Caudoviricetes sp.]|nr:major capsid protein [Caudoviricetes sp.]
MAVGGYVYTYPDVARREDLLDGVNMLDPTDTQFLSGVKQGTASNTLHEWIQETLEGVDENTQPEGGDAPADASSDPVRPVNITQIFAKTAKITGTELGVKRVGGNRMNRELMKKMKSLKGDIEFALIRGSIASGVASNSAASSRRLKGVKNWITTNVTNHSGTSLTETILNDLFEMVWGKGANVDAVYTPMKGKRRISAFTSGATKQVDLKDRRLVNAVDVYESDAAKLVKLFAHRYVTTGIGAGDTSLTGVNKSDYVTTATPGFDVLGLQEDTWATAWYRKPFTQDLAVTGDFKAKEIITELTLEALEQSANVLGRVFF